MHTLRIYIRHSLIWQYFFDIYYMNINKFNYLFFILLGIFWSGSFIAIKVIVNDFPPFYGASLRVGFALLFLLGVVYFLKKDIAVPFNLRWKIWLTGLLAQGFPFAFLFWGEQHVAPGLAGILNGSVPIWTFILCVFFARKEMNLTVLRFIGLLIGIIGIAIVFSPQINFSARSTNIYGAVAILMMAISYALGNIINQYLLRGEIKINFYANLVHQHWASLFFLLLLAILFEKIPRMMNYRELANIGLASIYLGVFSTGLAWIIYYHLIRSWDVVSASGVLYIVPVLALVWDWLFFGNIPKLSEIIGVITILSGVVLIQYKCNKKVNS